MTENIHEVVKFLRRMGYRQTEKVLKEESRATNMDSTLFELQIEGQSGVSSAFLHAPVINDTQPQLMVKDNFQALFTWSRESLDMFRADFESILFPIFIHSFLDLLGKNNIKEGMLCAGLNFSDIILFLVQERVCRCTRRCY